MPDLLTVPSLPCQQATLVHLSSVFSDQCKRGDEGADPLLQPVLWLNPLTNLDGVPSLTQVHNTEEYIIKIFREISHMNISNL